MEHLCRLCSVYSCRKNQDFEAYFISMTFGSETDPRRSNRMTESNAEKVRTSMTADIANVRLLPMSTERACFKNRMTSRFRGISD